MNNGDGCVLFVTSVVEVDTMGFMICGATAMVVLLVLFGVSLLVVYGERLWVVCEGG